MKGFKKPVSFLHMDLVAKTVTRVENGKKEKKKSTTVFSCRVDFELLTRGPAGRAMISGVKYWGIRLPNTVNWLRSICDLSCRVVFIFWS